MTRRASRNYSICQGTCARQDFRTRAFVTVGQYCADLAVNSWSIDFLDCIRSLERRALEEYFATKQASSSVQILLTSEVANAVLTIAVDQDNLQLCQSTLESQQATYNLIQQRFEVGFAPKFDLRQVQTRVVSARLTPLDSRR
jgi:multidrug efflux system outer membrane protein